MKRHLKPAICVLLTMVMIVSVFAVTSSSSAAEAKLPAKFDLRDRGVVTSVKKQDPWNTCWSFSAIAASEISILSKLGMTNEEFKAKNGGNELDLSEKHLAWFASRPITAATNPKQVGEGLVQRSDDPNAVYRNGGFPLLVTTLFSAGVGPVYEKYFPYQGKEGLTEKQFLKKYPDVAKEMGRMTLEQQTNMKVEEIVNNTDNAVVKGILDKFYDSGYLKKSDTLTAELLLQAAANYFIAKMAETNCYTKLDDWAIPDLDENGNANRDLTSGFTLMEGNILPALSIKKDGKWAGINEEGILAVKKELMKGRGVSAGFKADQASPGDPITEDGYINVQNWAHYTYEDVPQNHAVCIVGWDDDYPKENFNSKHMPPGNGAWLVKNSWGNEIDYIDGGEDSQVGKYDWGIVDKNGKHTGYFYISYYDKTLNNCETMEYDMDLARSGKLGVWMYDYMPAMTKLDMDTTVQDKNVIRTANVFYNDTGEDCDLRAVSTKTSRPNATVKYSLYRLNPNATNPEDGVLIQNLDPVTYEYAGFHLRKLDESITIKKGESLGIVVEETVNDEKEGTLYEYSVNSASSQKVAEETGDRVYGVAVVNKGESFIYENGAWTDWSEYEKRKEVADRFVTDNFSIKAYVVAQKNKSANPIKVTAKKKITVSAKKTTKIKKAITVKNAQGAVTYKTNNKKVTVKNGTIIVAKGLKRGKTYTVKVTVKAKGNENYKAGSKTVTVKITVKK